jgi:hypothetical protein
MERSKRPDREIRNGKTQMDEFDHSQEEEEVAWQIPAITGQRRGRFLSEL